MLTLWLPNLLLFVNTESCHHTVIRFGEFHLHFRPNSVSKMHNCLFICLSGFSLLFARPGPWFPFFAIILVSTACSVPDSSLRTPNGCHVVRGAQASSLPHFLPFSSLLSPSLEVALKMLLTLTPESCQCPGTPRRTSNMTKSGKTFCITLFSDGFHFPLK